MKQTRTPDLFAEVNKIPSHFAFSRRQATVRRECRESGSKRLRNNRRCAYGANNKDDRSAAIVHNVHGESHRESLADKRGVLS